jgi:hypothetical protein
MILGILGILLDRAPLAFFPIFIPCKRVAHKRTLLLRGLASRQSVSPPCTEGLGAGTNIFKMRAATKQGLVDTFKL